MDWKYRAVISSSIGLSTKHHITNFEKINRKNKKFLRNKKIFILLVF